MKLFLKAFYNGLKVRTTIWFYLSWWWLGLWMLYDTTEVESTILLILVMIGLVANDILVKLREIKEKVDA